MWARVSQAELAPCHLSWQPKPCPQAPSVLQATSHLSPEQSSEQRKPTKDTHSQSHLSGCLLQSGPQRVKLLPPPAPPPKELCDGAWGLVWKTDLVGSFSSVSLWYFVRESLKERFPFRDMV